VRSIAFHGDCGAPKHHQREPASIELRRVTRVYLDPGVIFVRSGAGQDDHGAVSPDAAEALENLASTGHDVILLTDAPVALPDGFPPILQAPRMEPGSAASWFLTANPEACGERRAGLRTMLVGPGPSTRRATIQRCDLQARDLQAAAIEILAREAMAPVG
jgi:hypothetical protein